MKDVLVELTNNGWKVSVGDIDEGTDDDWEYEIASFMHKHHALKWALDLFRDSDENSLLILLDYEYKTMEFKVFGKEDIGSLLRLISSEV